MKYSLYNMFEKTHYSSELNIQIFIFRGRKYVRIRIFDCEYLIMEQR